MVRAAPLPPRVFRSSWLTPEAAAALFALVKDYGLPLTFLVGLGWLILTGKLVTGSQLETMTQLFERERADRIAAEATLAKFATANAEVAEAVREALVEVVKRPDPYTERVSGTTRRGR